MTKSSGPEQQKQPNVTDTRHRSPRGRAGATSGARLCGAVPNRARPASGGFHRAGLPDTKSVEEIRKRLGYQDNTAKASSVATLAVNALFALAWFRMAVAS